MIDKDILINGDCLSVMNDIPDKAIDCIITDLPYGCLHKDNPNAQWDSIIPFEPLWAQYERIIKDNGAILLFAQGMFTAQLMMSNPKLWHYNLVWDKQRVTGFLNANRMPLRCHEDICVFYKGLPTYNPQLEVGIPNHSRGNGKHKDTNQCYGKYGNNHKGTVYEEVARVAPTVPDGMKMPRSIISIQKEHESGTKHPCLPAGTKVWFEDKWVNIENVSVGDRNDFGSVAAITTHYAEKIIEVIVGNESVRATWNHPFLIKRDKAIFWVDAEQIKKGDYVLCQKKENIKSFTSLLKKDIYDLEGMKKVTTNLNIAMCGKNILEKFQTVCRYITKILTRRIMILPICSLSLPLSTSGCTKVANLLTVCGISLVRYAENTNHVQKSFGIFREGGLMVGRVKSVISKIRSKHVLCELREVGSVRIIQEKTKVYNLTIDGVPAFETKCGITHNTQKPVDLLRYLIRTYSNEGDTILDSCMGSGTTCVAAVKEKRHFIGIEKEEKYFEIARKRVELERMQPTLF